MMTKRLLHTCWFLLAALLVAAQPSAAVTLPQTDGQHLGKAVRYMKEARHPLTLQQALAAYRHGAFTRGTSPVLTFGIGSAPVWFHLDVDNVDDTPLTRQISIGTAWLDDVDIYVLRAGNTVAAWHMGDRLPHDRRPIHGRGFVVQHDFPPGRSEIMIRVATPDPMVVPITLDTPAHTAATEYTQVIIHAFVYGFLFALMAYNFVLFAGLRSPRYGLYSLYLGAFILTNASYSGYAFEWLWPARPGWAQWSQPVLMLLYAACGLLFALSFLETRRHLPRWHRAVLGYIGTGVLALAATFLLRWQTAALQLAFLFVTLFTVIMLALGVFSMRAGARSGRYFLLAAACSMAGAATTALAVWGFIPFTAWTFRAVDVGMLLDATLLALALSYQVREGEQRRESAEHLARQDPLTRVNNRRAFYEISEPIWSITRRHLRQLSVILLDVDRFKHVNDQYGHGCGDQVLRSTADALKSAIRDPDVIARWGGEEFIILLPETALTEAIALAERLRHTVEASRPLCHGQAIPVTISLGVAQCRPHHQTLDALISEADSQLYRAKEEGRNRACHAAGDIQTVISEERAAS